MSFDSPPPSPLNESTEPPEATLDDQLTCPNHARKRKRTIELSRPRPKRLALEKVAGVLTEDEDESAGEEQIKAPKRKRRRDLDSPPASPSAPNEPVSSSPIRSEEAIKFENAIVRGSWANVFYRFGGALVRSGGSLLDGVNLDLYDSRGMTSLHSAAAIGDAELTVLLLKRGAKHQLATLSGWTTWHIATGHIDVLHAMLDFLRPKMS